MPHDSYIKYFTGKELEEKITLLWENKREAHFFCDEMPIGKDGIQQEFLIQFSKKLLPENFLWIAWNSNLVPTSQLKTGKSYLKINSSMTFTGHSSDGF